MYEVDVNNIESDELNSLLKSLLKLDRETEWLELKCNNGKPKMIGEYISALSNSATLNNRDYGYLIYGIDNETKEVVGTTLDLYKMKKGNEPLYNWLYRKINPQTDFRVNTINVDGKKVLIIEIDKAKVYPVEFDGVAHIRIGEQKKKLHDCREKEKKLWNELNRTNFETAIALSKLSIDNIFELLEIGVYYKYMKLPMPRNDQKIIDDFIEEGFLKKHYGKLAITNLGAILFAKDIYKFSTISRKAIRVIQYDGRNKINTIREIEYSQGYAVCFEQILSNLDLLTPQNEHIGLALRTQIKMYPDKALRELIANAMIHQDFMITGTGILIELYSDRLEISNPGIPLIDVDRFIDHSPISRNEQLAKKMRMLNLCEEKGSGIDKTIGIVELFQLPPPSFLKYENSTKVILYEYKKLADMDRDEKIRACYQHACLQYVSNKKMTNETLRKRFNIEKKNSATASRILRDSVKANLIKEEEKNFDSRRYKCYIPYWV